MFKLRCCVRHLQYSLCASASHIATGSIQGPFSISMFILYYRVSRGVIFTCCFTRCCVVLSEASRKFTTSWTTIINMTLQSFNIIIGDRCLQAYPYDYYSLSCIYALCQNIITSMFQTEILSTFYLFIKY